MMSELIRTESACQRLAERAGRQYEPSMFNRMELAGRPVQIYLDKHRRKDEMEQSIMDFKEKKAMAISKQQYLQRIRNETSYPTYRSIIGIIAILGYIMAVLMGLGALGGGIAGMSQSFFAGLGTLVVGLVAAVIMFFLARFWKEAALILVDIGDSVADANAKNESHP